MLDDLLHTWPSLRERLDAAALGDFPTPIERLSTLERELAAGPLYVKRDDRSALAYGGNKVRTLEVLFGRARAEGAREIIATGAFGSNHAVATVLHARRAGLAPGAVLFPQPHSAAAHENFRVTLAHAERLVIVPHWSCVPYGMWRARGAERSVMAPGGATPLGALGYVAAALELAAQVERGELTAPRRIVVGVGSTCTSAGLLVGLAHAARLGFGFRRAPELVSVRVAPWPVTSRFRILGLAVRASRLLADLANDASLSLTRAELAPCLRVDGAELGAGFGKPSPGGRAAIELFRAQAGFELDTTYSGKAAAGFLAAARRDPEGPSLFWSTKSTRPLPSVTDAELERAPRAALRWLARAPRVALPP
ncbi:MAG TPA: pyridoxal-phosphate dependent enzyme [Polyangiaceae bacterium]|nr:pyridoxal-phosphate dependent enzyme [Polyangiaceae bacterium]